VNFVVFRGYKTILPRRGSKRRKKEKPKNMLRVMICWLRAFVNFVLFYGQSYHIHAGALHFIEESETKKDDDYAYYHTDTDLPEVNCSLSHEGETEGFDDENHGIQGEKPSKILRHRT